MKNLLKIIVTGSLLVSFVHADVIMPPQVSCKQKARAITDKAVELFKVKASRTISCQATGELVSFEQLAVIQVMPVRYAYEAKYKFICAPYAPAPEVNLVLDSTCNIVELNLKGFEL